MATGKRDRELYVLERDNSTFILVLRKKNLRASYDLWHSRLGHVNHSVISFLNRKGHLFSYVFYCLLHHYVILVNLQKVIDCLIPAMNVGRLMC